MATGAADLLEGPLALGQEGGIFESLDIQMTGRAAGLGLFPPEQRLLPIMDLSVRLFDTVNGRPLSLVAHRTDQDVVWVSSIEAITVKPF
jgi:hypothetical protein